MSSPTFELENLVVRAGAGAGKTTALTERVLGLAESYIAKHDKDPHFIVTTFTRKATQELRERLLKEALKRNSQRLVDFVQRPSCLHISTIHGVLGLFLSRYGAGIGLSPQLKVISEVQEKLMIKKLIRSLNQNNQEFGKSFQSLLETVEFSDLLSSLQTYAELNLKYPELDYATAKDFQSLLTERLFSLKLIATEFIEQIYSQTDQEAWLKLAEYIKVRILPICDNENLENSLVSLQGLSQISEDMPATRKTKDMSEQLPELKKHLNKHLDALGGFAFSKEFFDLHLKVSTEFKFCADLIAEALLKQKLEMGQLTMADLENLSLYLIHKDPHSAKAFSKDWNYWLIDEYQDTSPVQVQILKALIDKTESFVVGDPQQSIYLFRGARSEVFLEQEARVESKGGKSLTLMKNYRSRPELLLFFNDFFTKMSKQFQTMEPGPGPKNAKPVEASVANIYVLPEPAKDERDPEIEAVLERCFELQSHGVSLENICILGRTNKTLDEIALKAVERGLPVQVHSAGDFFERREVLDAMIFLKFLANPHDNLNFMQLIRSPFFRISDAEAIKFCHRDKESFWIRAKDSSPDQEVLLRLNECLEQTHKVGVGESWVQGLLKNGYFDLSYKIDPTGRREANLWKLISLIRQEERKPGFSYLSFLRSKELLETDTESGGESDAVPVVEPKRVNLMTVHASKGLQFQYLIVPNMGSAGRAPVSEFFMFDESSQKWTLSLPDPEDSKRTASLLGLEILQQRKIREASESERVLYVALTRAIMNVTLIWTEKFQKDSWASKITMDLAAGDHQQENYQYKVIKELSKSAWGDKHSHSEISPLKKWETANETVFKTVSVTDLLEKVEVKANKKSSTNAVDAIQKAIKGVDVHRILESYKYLYLKNPQISWQDYAKTLKPDAHKAFSYVMTDQQGLWKEVIEQGHVEWGFSVLSPEGLVQGQIDLWGTVGKKAYIVDYKTGSPFHKEKAFKQLEIYSWALQKMKKLDSSYEIQLVVIYPFSNLTEIR